MVTREMREMMGGGEGDEKEAVRWRWSRGDSEGGVTREGRL